MTIELNLRIWYTTIDKENGGHTAVLDKAGRVFLAVINSGNAV